VSSAMDEYRDLVVAAGLDPSEVEIEVARRRGLRRERAVLARHVSGLWSRADRMGSTRENACAAIAGVVDLLSGESS
jgi:hypothetical protein